MSTSLDMPASTVGSRGISALWRRQLHRYPERGQRFFQLGITVVATVIFYYENYVLGSVATKILAQFHLGFVTFVFVLVAANLLGAFSSLCAGLADRWGRANLVAYGLVITGLITFFLMPNATNATVFSIGICGVGVIEGIALVATPALIRDFSPQMGRASAMGFWTIGPVLGSLVVTLISSHTLTSHPDWGFQYQLCGVIGLVVALVAVLWLRELSPRLRDQLMVSLRDRALVEARASDIDPEALEKGQWRQMLGSPRIVSSSFAIGLMLMIYYMFVAFLVVYFVTVHGYTEAKTNSLANWYWATDAIALIVVGILSDRFLVRKPFMLGGALLFTAASILFAISSTDSGTSYHHFALLFVLMAIGNAVSYVAWMAAFTETVESINPAATATGLAVYGWIIRLMVVLGFALLPAVVPATGELADHGARVAEIAAKYPTQVKVLSTVDPATLSALGKNPNNTQASTKAVEELTGLTAAQLKDPANKAEVSKAKAALASMDKIPASDVSYMAAHGADVAQAAKDNPDQWRTWWWFCVACQALFFPCIFVLRGRWSSRRAKREAAEHEAMVARELARLEQARTAQD